MTASNAFESLANTLSLGDWEANLKHLKKIHKAPKKDSLVIYHGLTEDDHSKAADTILEAVKDVPKDEREHIHAGDDLAAHLVWIVEALQRLQVNDEAAAETTQQVILDAVEAAR